MNSAKSRHSLAVTAAARHKADASRATTTADWLRAKKKEGRANELAKSLSNYLRDKI